MLHFFVSVLMNLKKVKRKPFIPADFSYVLKYGCFEAQFMGMCLKNSAFILHFIALILTISKP